jgi:hypothetical protein
MANTVYLQTRKPGIRSPAGAGEKIIRGTSLITPGTDALWAQECNLKTIRKLYVQSRGVPGTFVWPIVSTPGTFNNYASFYVARGRVANGTIALCNGGMNAGTHILDWVAFGD